MEATEAKVPPSESLLLLLASPPARSRETRDQHPKWIERGIGIDPGTLRLCLHIPVATRSLGRSSSNLHGSRLHPPKCRSGERLNEVSARSQSHDALQSAGRGSQIDARIARSSRDELQRYARQRMWNYRT